MPSVAKAIGAFSEASYLTMKDLTTLRGDLYGAALPGTLFLQWFFTSSCNLECPYCDGVKAKSRDLSEGEREKGLDFLHERFHPSILNITGGEPTIKYDELLQFISHGRRLGMFVTLNTNGTLLSIPRIEELAEAGLGYLSISYDGIAPKDNPQVLEYGGLALFSGIFTVIQPVLSQSNWDLRHKILSDSRERDLWFNPSIVHSLGLDYSSAAGVAPPAEEVQMFFAQLAHEKTLSRIKPMAGFLEYVAREYGNPWHCQDFKWLTVSNDGTMRHCNEFKSDFTIEDLADEHALQAFNEYRKEKSHQCPGCYYECYVGSDGNLMPKLRVADLVMLESGARIMHFYRAIRIVAETIEKYYPDSALGGRFGGETLLEKLYAPACEGLAGERQKTL